MNSPADNRDNLYQAPATQLVPADVVEGSTANGSRIKIGPRRKFTMSFTVTMGTLVLVALLGQFALMGALFVILAAAGFPGLGLLFAVAGFLLAYALLLPWYSGIAIADFMAKPTHLEEQRQFVVGLRLVPRPTPRKALDDDDDTGVFSLHPDALQFHGDAVQMNITRRDILSIRAERASWMKLGLIGPDAVVAFREPMLGCRSVKFIMNEGRTTWKARRRARQLVGAMEAWSRQDDTRATA